MIIIELECEGALPAWSILLREEETKCDQDACFGEARCLVGYSSRGAISLEGGREPSDSRNEEKTIEDMDRRVWS